MNAVGNKMRERNLAQSMHLHNHEKFKSVVMIADVDRI